MKFNFKRFLAFALALVMVLGYVPAGAFATEDATVVTTDGQFCNALRAGGKVKLGSDIVTTNGATIPSGKSVVLDLNGYEISSDNRFGNSIITNDGDLTVCGSGKLTRTVSGNSIKSSGTLRIEGGEFGGNSGTLIITDGTAEICGGKFINSYTNSTVSVQGGTLTITDGEFEANHNCMAATGGEVRIEGGKFSNKYESAALLRCDAKASLTVTGGTFNRDVSEYVPIACEIVPNEDGTWTVKATANVAKVGDTEYPTLADAIAKAQAGETIKLIRDVALSDPLVIGENQDVTLDLNGYILSYESTVMGEAMITNKGDLTIEDSSDTDYGVIYYNYKGEADSSYGKGNYTISNGGKLTVNSGNITIAYLRGHAKYPIDNNSTTGNAELIINGGHLYNYNTAAIRQFCNSETYKNSVTINGGLVEGYCAIWMQNPGKKTVHGSLTITGGEIRTTAAAYVDGTSELKDVASRIYCTTEGGEWSGESAVSITGGTINENVCLTENAPADITIGENAEFNGYVDVPAQEAPERPTATVTEVEKEDLTFALNFLADEATDEQLAYYGNWYADFVLTVNKDVTFNANGGADGYLSGQYDEWSDDWVNVPLENVTLNAGESLKIMEYAAETMGQSGLKVTYNDVLTAVKDFDCGVFFEDAFLAANPDIEVQLELRMYNPADESESYVIGETYIFTLPQEAPALPTATVTGIENDDLTFALNFLADEATATQLAYYGNWYADFVLTVNKDVTFNANGGADGYLSGQYDAWSENWVSVPFDDVTLKAGETLKIMAYAAELLGEPGLKYTYGEVYEVVKDFDCGVYFTPEFLAANRDLEVRLELRMYNPADESESYVIGETYIFTLGDYVAMNVQTGKLYMDVSEGLEEAEAGQTVVLLKDASDRIVTVLEDTSFDLDGYQLTAEYVASFGDIVDNSEANSGRLIVDRTRMLIQEKNAQLPVNTGEGYLFAEIEKYNWKYKTAESKYIFQPFVEATAHSALKAGKESSGVTIEVEITWRAGDGVRRQNFEYDDAKVLDVVSSYNSGTNKYGRQFALTMTGASELVDLKIEAVVRSETGVSLSVSDIENRAEEEKPEEEKPEEGKTTETTEEKELADGGNTAVVPEGTKVQEGVDLDLIVTVLDSTSGNIVAGDDETLRSVDVHVEGLAADNTKPILVTLTGFAEPGLNDGNLRLYHVENGESKAMTQVWTADEVDTHNEFYYDPATGDVIMALASFSEITMVAEYAMPWKGEVKTDWYDDSKTLFEIFNADQLAGLGALVDNGNTFDGKTIVLCNDINLSGDGKGAGISFKPIGTGYDDARAFMGTFDGNGCTITGLHQNGWDLEAAGKGDYTYTTLGGGLFAYAKNATFKNLTLDKAYIVMECIDMGTLVGYAYGECHFENIFVTNSTIANYNRYTGGVVGEVGGGVDSEDEDTYTHTFVNVDVDAGTTISALWGTFDPGVGGIIGGKWGTATVYMKGCDVACKLDVFNDVTSAYRWYSYRRCGMLIGYSEESKTVNGRTEATATYLTTEDCTVAYGDWTRYHYCKFSNENYPYVRKEAGLFNGAYSNPRYGLPKDVNGTKLTEADIDEETGEHKDGVHSEGEDHHIEIVFNQLYGGGQGCYGGNSHVGKGVTVYTKDTAPKVTKKFDFIDTEYIVTGDTYTLDELFKEIEGVDVKDFYVYASVTPKNADDSVRGTFTKVKNDDWTQSTIAFTGEGMVRITISDYYFCELTTVYVFVGTKAPAVKFEATSVAEQSTYTQIKLGNLFSLVEGKEIVGNVTAEISGPDMEPVVINDITGWESHTIDLTKAGDWTVVINDEDIYSSEPVQATFTVKEADKLTKKFDKNFLYRVGNANAVGIGYIFGENTKDYTLNLDQVKVTVETVAGNATGTFTSDATWTNGKIQFTDTGVVKVTISAEGAKPVELHLEVVDASNITGATGTTTGGNFVLLCNVNTTNYVNYRNCTLYGNGFTYSLYGAPTDYNSKQGHGVLITSNAILDNLVIVGDIYDSYGAFSTQNNYNAAIHVLGSTTIRNCYIANCATPIRCMANTTIEDSTLYGGAVANLIIESGVVTLTNVTTANFPDGRKVVGLGIVASDKATDEAKLVLNGNFTQYNFISEANKPSDSNAAALYNEVFGTQCADYHYGTSPNRYINTGIASMSVKFGEGDIIDNANTGYTGITAKLNGVNGYLYSTKNPQSVNNGYVEEKDPHRATVQGPVAPDADFDHTPNERPEQDGSNVFCYEENGVVTISMNEGDTFAWDTSILTVNKNGQTIPYTVSMNGVDYTGSSITFNTAGSYEVKYGYTDNDNYAVGEDGEITTYSKSYEEIIRIQVLTVKKAWKDAEINVTKTAMSGIYVMSGDYDYSYKMKFLDCITVKDYDGDGNAETVNLASGIKSVSFVSFDAKGVETDPGKFDHNNGVITITYNSGQTLTVKIGTWSGSGPSTKTCSVKTNDGVFLITDGASNAANTGVTWKITGYTYTGNSGKLVSSDTTITFTWDTNSEGYNSKSECVTPDTLITLADGSQVRVDSLTGNEELLVWNMIEGKLDSAPILFLDSEEESEFEVVHLYFSDGTDVKVIYEHGFWDYDLNKYVYLDRYAEKYIGHTFAKQNGDELEKVVLTDVVIETEVTTAWSPVTAGHLCYFVNGMLSMPGGVGGLFNIFEVDPETMIYDPEAMQRDIETYGLFTYEEMNEIVPLPLEMFETCGGAYLKVSIGKGNMTIDDLIYMVNRYRSFFE